MGKTSAAAKNRYAEKAYDRVALILTKGKKEKVQALAASGGESLNGFINRAISELMEREGVLDVFLLEDTPAAQDAEGGSGVLVLKHGMPQLFVASPDGSPFEMSMINADPANIEEIERTTEVYSGRLVGLVFLADRRLFPVT